MSKTFYMLLDVDHAFYKGEFNIDCKVIKISDDLDKIIDELHNYVKRWNDDTREDIKDGGFNDDETVWMEDNPMDHGNVYEELVPYYRHEYANGDWHAMYVRIDECDLEDN